MSDWEFLYEMSERGCSQKEIADAASSGAAPWEWEYVSREWIDDQFEDELESDEFLENSGESFQRKDEYPNSILKQAEILEDLVQCAMLHFENTGRYLQIWGELGEIYAEIRFGLRRHETGTAGSDGTISGKLVEVKTISPEKSNDHVLVKSQGNFEQLLIVRIDHNFNFTGKIIERSELKRYTGKFLKGKFQNGVENA